MDSVMHDDPKPSKGGRIETSIQCVLRETPDHGGWHPQTRLRTPASPPISFVRRGRLTEVSACAEAEVFLMDEDAFLKDQACLRAEQIRHYRQVGQHERRWDTSVKPKAEYEQSWENVGEYYDSHDSRVCYNCSRSRPTRSYTTQELCTREVNTALVEPARPMRLGKPDKGCVVSLSRAII